MAVLIRLVLPYPPSANTYWRSAPGRGLVPSDEAREYKRLVREQNPSASPLIGDVVLSGTIFRPRRAGDLGNRLKVLEDALIGIAYLDDGQISEYRRIRRTDEDPDHPRVEVLLVGLAFATPREKAEAAAGKAAAAKKRRESTNRNRAAKRLAGAQVSSAVRR